MSQSSDSRAAHTSDELAVIDELCDQFEAAWRRVDAPRVEEFVERVDESLRPMAESELRKIDRHWRSSVTTVASPQEPVGALAPESNGLGPFRDLQRIGEGAYGVVYRAWDSRHNRVVALKLPRFGFDLAGADLDRFLREARSAGSLDHPSIARVWDSGRIAGVTYIACQFIEGENLRERLSEFHAWPPRRVAGLVRQVAEAAQAAHDRGVIHRDIKPSNLLLTANDRPVLTDFGLALARGGDDTRSFATHVGTLDYMPPEQASGDSARVDERADVWSLGVLLYELLTGHKPFGGASDIEALRSLLRDEPQPPRRLRRDVPRDLDVLTLRCLEKRREDRLSSCALLAEELGRVERGEPILSRPVSSVERVARWSRNNPRPIGAFAAILFATAFGAWSWGGWVSDLRRSENTVQQLRIEVESERAQRRELLRSALMDRPLELSEADIEYLETVSEETDNRDLSALAAEHVARQLRAIHDRSEGTDESE